MSNENKKLNVAINNSLLVDEEKILSIIIQIAREKAPKVLEYPSSFSEISKDILDKMIVIDKFYQRNIITKEETIQIFADLLLTDCIKKEYKDSIFLNNVKKLDELLETKYQDLLNAYNNGIIDETEYFEKFRQLINFEINSINEIYIIDEPIKTK